MQGSFWADKRDFGTFRRNNEQMKRLGQIFGFSSQKARLYFSSRFLFPKHRNDLGHYFHRDTFYEGKELADEAEILELPAQQDDPQDYYYGQGADYDESWLSDGQQREQLDVRACDPQLAEALKDVMSGMIMKK